MGLPDVTWLKVEVKEFDIRPGPRLDDILGLLANRLTGAHYNVHQRLGGPPLRKHHL